MKQRTFGLRVGFMALAVAAALGAPFATQNALAPGDIPLPMRRGKPGRHWTKRGAAQPISAVRMRRKARNRGARRAAARG